MKWPTEEVTDSMTNLCKYDIIVHIDIVHMDMYLNIYTPTYFKYIIHLLQQYK